MSTTDCSRLHVYRLPIYQKKVIGIDNCTSNTPQTRSPSSSKSLLASGRRHSTPQASSKLFFDINSPPSNTCIKYYQSYPKTTCINKEQNHLIDSNKSPSRSISLVKLRNPDERVNRLAITPTSINSFADIILPIAKKNINTIVEAPSSISTEIQSNNQNRSISTTKQGKTVSLNLERDVFLDERDSHDESLQDNIAKLKSRKRYHQQCLHCNFCHLYCSCPFCCWILCIILVISLFIGLYLSRRFLFV